MSDPHHRLTVDQRIGALQLQAELHFAAPWTVIFGPSGSGKSSLLKAACGLLPATFARHEPTGWVDLSHQPTHCRKLGYAPQGASLFPHRGVRENIVFAAQVRGLKNAALTNEILDLFALTPFAERMPNDLSGGERQRVNLARAFAVPHPRLMLLDEPFSGIDRSMRERLISACASRNVPILSVTHDIEEAVLLGAEVLRIDAGRITAAGPANEVLAPEIVRMREILSGTATPDTSALRRP